MSVEQQPRAGRRKRARKAWAHVLPVAFVALVYSVSLAFIDPEGVWIADNGNKLIQLEGILGSSYSDFSLRWPGREIDPGYKYVPIDYPFGVVRGDRLYSIFSPFFATVSAPFYKVWGYKGLYVLPLMSSILMLLAVGWIMDTAESGPRARLYSVLIAGLCTPVWFYSITFWEHAPAVCMAMWAVAAALRSVRRGSLALLAATAVLAASSVYFRDELYSFCIVLALVSAYGMPGRRLVAGGVFVLALVLALIPLWLFNSRTIGAPFGFHLEVHLLSTSGLLRHLADRPRVFYNLFLFASKKAWASLLLSTPYLAAFGLYRWLPDRVQMRGAGVYCGVALVTSAVVYSCYLWSERPVLCMAYSNSLFPAAPVLVLAFLKLGERCTPKGRSGAGVGASAITPNGSSSGSGGAPAFSRVRLVGLICVLYAIAYAVAAPKVGSWGIHWGNRYLLVLYPLLSLLAADNIAAMGAGGRRGRLVRVLVVATALAALGAQVYSVSLVKRKTEFSHRLNHRIGEYSEDIIVTDQWWLAQELFSHFYTKKIFRIESQRDYDDLMRRLFTLGEMRHIYVSPPMTDEAPPTGGVAIDDGGLNYWNLLVFPVDLSRRGR